MTYRQAIDYLNSFIDFERLPEPRMVTTDDDIARFRELLARLGNPHRRYPVLHVVGTKGKGSTSALLAFILTAHGLKVGLYTSPHLVSVRERTMIDGRPVGRREFASAMARIEASSPQQSGDIRLAFRTVFEHLTAAAFINFADAGVDVAVVEAGLGARLDATIVVDPVLTVLTPIGLDHTNVLGGTIREIAWDKAHSIKSKGSVVSAPQVDEAAREIEARAAHMGARLHFAQGREEFTTFKASLRGSTVRGSVDLFGEKPLQLPLAGSFQLENLSTALEAVRWMRDTGFLKPKQEAVREGIRRVRWPGRLQRIIEHPLVVLDGAHNELAAHNLVSALKQIAPGRKWEVVYSSILNKPAAGMLRALKPISRQVHLAALCFPKGLHADALRVAAEEAGVEYSPWPDVPTAIRKAMERATADSGVLVTGSLYLVGEALRWKRGLSPPPADGRIDDRI
ncbi:MAG: bifunctional folylpolyglutamate synthase/dihydrofolate synthase [Calditrichaeota bacterium]|nr:bifunctional folylpolyglutamate synthase/dihydrofolate synthase [Calditrichota bacterium]